jgi:Rps23 Pro-64 3,4-dihydroxylase Tpa1-like proline 4-hydroxylase
MSVLAPYDREALKTQFQTAKPFRWLKIDGFLKSELADLVSASYPPFEQAAALGDQFTRVNENRKVQIVDYERFPDPVKQLADAIASQSFMDDLAYIVGIPNLLWDAKYAGGGMHETANSGWLDVHIDFNFNDKMMTHRRLNILIFLNPVWDEQWGGVLELWDIDVKNREHGLLPLHNRCVIFETSDISWHGVTSVQCPPGIVRKSFAAYYYTKEAPAGWDGQMHNTIFKARPDEYMKRHLLMPAEGAKEKMREGMHAAKSVVKKLIGRT